MRGELAAAFRMAEADVRVVSPPMGGSFGAKTFTRIEAIAAALARKAGAPVKVVLPREEVFVTLVRHPARIRVRLGARGDGTFVARRVWAEWDTGAYADTGPNVAAKGAWAALGPYRCPHVVVESDCVYTNSPSAGAYRGYAATQAAWAGEQCVDLLADALGVDPLDLRLRNVLRDGDCFATGEVMHDFHVAECLEQVARRIGWHADRRGKGLCALMKGMQTPSRSEARVVLDDGVFTVESATTDVGQGRDGTLRAIASSRLGVDTAAIGTAPVDTDRSPFDTRTTSSRSAHMMSGAVGRAADDLRRQLADDLEAAPADLRFTRGGVEVAGSPGTWRPLESLGTIVGRGEWEIAGGLDPDTGHGIASAHWHQGAGAVAVTVDEETGIVQIADLAGRRVRRKGDRRIGRGAPVRGLDRHGRRQRPLRGDRLPGRPARDEQLLRLPHPGLPRHPAVHRRGDRDGPAPTSTGSARPRSRWSLPPSGTPCGRLASPRIACPSRPESVLAALDRSHPK